MLLTRRRTFLGGLLAVFAAPAIVRAQSLMPINSLLVPERQLILPRMRVLGPPHCDLCYSPWGMCSHTGGPMDMNDSRLAQSIVEDLRVDAWRQDNRMKHPARVNLWHPLPKT